MLHSGKERKILTIKLKNRGEERLDMERVSKTKNKWKRKWKRYIKVEIEKKFGERQKKLRRKNMQWKNI
jgi:hypothetical protein